MKISDRGLALIQRFEGCSLRAYRDRVGVWTIGWGTTNADKALTGVTIRQGLSISRKTAEEWLRRSLNEKYGPKVTKYQDKYGWNQNEFDALVSFAYNLGHIDGLTQNGQRSRAQIQAAWTLYDKAGGKHVKGLLERRQAELRLFLEPVTPLPEPSVCSNAVAEQYRLQRWTPRGERVVQVQRELLRLGYDLGPTGADGVCGALTTTAILFFQRSAGLTADGICGPKTWAALQAAQPLSPSAEADKADKKAATSVKEADKADKKAATADKKAATAVKEADTAAKEADKQPPVQQTPVDYLERVAEQAKRVYPLCVGKVHSGADVGKVNSLEALKAHKALSCNRMVSIVLQQAGLLDKGVVVSHTAKASGKKKITDAVKNTAKLRHCKVYWVNKRFGDLPEAWKRAGCVYFQNSNACISAGNGKIWSCNKSKGYRYQGRGDYLRTEGYPFTSRILVVVVPD